MRNERGSAGSVFLIAGWAVALFALIIAVDAGRGFIIREQLHTAADAAALHGVSQVVRMVEVTVYRQTRNEKTCEDANATAKCYTEWRQNNYNRTDTEVNLWDRWTSLRNGVCGPPETTSCSSEVWKCFVVPKNGDWRLPEQSARAAFMENAAGKSWAPYLKRVEMRYVEPQEKTGPDRRVGWYEFQVVVSAEVEYPTVFWRPGGQSGMITTLIRESKGILLRSDRPRSADPPCQ